MMCGRLLERGYANPACVAESEEKLLKFRVTGPFLGWLSPKGHPCDSLNVAYLPKVTILRDEGCISVSD